MLISFIALIYLVDGCFGAVHNALASHGVAWFPSSVEQIFGWVFSPVAWLIGIPWHDCPTIGNLLGLRMVTNELVAFQRLGPMQTTLDPAPTQLPRLRFAGSRISAPSAFRLAASELWLPTSAQSWPSFGSAL
jgi:nucleoside permease NupC